MPGSIAWPGVGSAPAGSGGGPGTLGDSTAGDKSVSGGGSGLGTGGGATGASGGGGLAGIGGDKYVYEMVAMVKNVDFLVLRARQAYILHLFRPLPPCLFRDFDWSPGG